MMTGVSFRAQTPESRLSYPEPSPISFGVSSTKESSSPASEKPTIFSAKANGKQIPQKERGAENAAARTSGQSSQATSDDGWKFGFAPYLFAAGLSGTIGANGRSVEVDASFGDVWGRLDFGLMGTFEARKGRFVSLTDTQWVKMSAERESPGGLFSKEKVTVNLFIIDPEAGFRVASGERGSFDVLGGVRIWRINNDLDATTGILPGFEVTRGRTFAAPVVGFKGMLNITPKLFLSTKMDVGGAGSVKSTSQVYAGGGFRLTKAIALIGGYRYLQVNYDDGPDFIFDTTMSGLLFGARFDF